MVGHVEGMVDEMKKLLVLSSRLTYTDETEMPDRIVMFETNPQSHLRFSLQYCKSSSHVED